VDTTVPPKRNWFLAPDAPSCDVPPPQAVRTSGMTVMTAAAEIRLAVLYRLGTPIASCQIESTLMIFGAEIS
jgi:hypothetical protein